MRSGSSVASREKHYGSDSTTEEDSDESYSSDDGEATDQRSSSSNDKTKGGTDYDEEAPTTEKGTKKADNPNTGTPSEDSEVSDDDGTTSNTKSGSSKSTLEDAEENSQDSDTINSETQGSNDSLTGAGDKESELGNSVSTSSRLKTVHSKPTATPLPAGDVNAAAPTLPLPSAAPSAQTVGCAGGTNATSSYCSPSNSANRATYISKLDLRTFFVTVLFCWFGLL